MHEVSTVLVTWDDNVNPSACVVVAILDNLVHEAAGDLTFPLQIFDMLSDESLGEHWIVAQGDEDQFIFSMLLATMFLELSRLNNMFEAKVDDFWHVGEISAEVTGQLWNRQISRLLSVTSWRRKAIEQLLAQFISFFLFKTELTELLVYKIWKTIYLVTCVLDLKMIENKKIHLFPNVFHPHK